jgi:hypothetical protein
MVHFSLPPQTRDEFTKRIFNDLQDVAYSDNMGKSRGKVKAASSVVLR